MISQHRNECNFKARLPTASRVWHAPAGPLCSHPFQYCRRPLPRQHHSLSSWFPFSNRPGLHPIATSPGRQACPILVMTVHHTPPGMLTLPSPSLSYLRPPCKAADHIFLWRGINTPPSSTIDNPIIRHIASIANRASLRDTANYGSGLRKFHLFCDIFSVPESDRLPASFELLHSFALWAVTDPEPGDPILSTSSSIPFEPVSVGVARKYLSAI
jgi:hypothetical protein